MNQSCFENSISSNNTNTKNNTQLPLKTTVKKTTKEQNPTTVKKIKTKSNKSKPMNRIKKLVNAPLKVIKQTLSTTTVKRRKLPYGLRSNVWTKYNGEVFNAKCYVDFCEQIVNPFTFEVGHDIPVSKGGTDSISNLRPICRNCNNSMSNNYTIAEYSETFK